MQENFRFVMVSVSKAMGFYETLSVCPTVLLKNMLILTQGVYFVLDKRRSQPTTKAVGFPAGGHSSRIGMFSARYQCRWPILNEMSGTAVYRSTHSSR